MYLNNVSYANTIELTISNYDSYLRFLTFVFHLTTFIMLFRMFFKVINYKNSFNQ